MEVKFPARVIKGCLLLIKHRTVQGSSGLDVPETQFFFFPFPALCTKSPQCDLLELSLCLGFQSLFMFPLARGDVFLCDATTRLQLQPCLFTDPWKPEHLEMLFRNQTSMNQELLTAGKNIWNLKSSTFQTFEFFYLCLHCLFVQLYLEWIFLFSKLFPKIQF